VSELRFRLSAAAGLPAGSEVPVEVRRADATLVGRGLSSGTVSVAPGTYFVTARLPGGGEAVERVKVTAGEEGPTVTLEPPAAGAPAARPESRRAGEAPRPTESRGRPRGFGVAPAESDAERGLGGPRSGPGADEPGALRRPRRRFLGGGGSRGMVSASEPEAREPFGNLLASDAARDTERPAPLRRLAGNLLASGFETVPWPAAESAPRLEPDGSVRIEVRGEDRPLYAQLLQPDAPPLVVALPAWADPDRGLETRCTLTLRQTAGGPFTATAEPAHAQAALLLLYRERSLAAEAHAAVLSPALAAERLLEDKLRDPVAAAAGAYALLRFGLLDRLRDWTGNLMEWFPALPDGAAVRAEHLARLGRHEEALAALLALGGRGLPLFSDGVALAADRLRIYLSLGRKALPAADLDGAEDLLYRLERFVPVIDFERPVTTFTGLGPDAPDGAGPAGGGG